MKKFRYFVPVVIVFILLFTLVSCDFSESSQGNEAQPALYYYENTNGVPDKDKWIAFIGNEWLYYDETGGTFSVSASGVYTLKTDGTIWARGSLSGEYFLLEKGGETIVYSDGETESLSEETTLAQMIYADAVKMGFEGSLDELIALLKGESGQSAYDIAVSHGYRGSEAEWIASLSGGDGQTPYIGSDGHWMVGEIDTGVSAAGTGIVKMEKVSTQNNVDTYTFYLTDGTTYDFTVTNGLNGEAAEKGTGIEKIERTSSEGDVDVYTISLTDGTSYDFTVTNGKDGEDALRISPEDIYNEAVEKGYAGTYLEFLGEFLAGQTVAEAANVSSSCFSTVSIMSVYYQNFIGVTRADASGTGIIYQINKRTGDALILTNYHVVYAANQVTAQGVAAPGIAEKLYVYLFGSEVVGNEYNPYRSYPGMFMEAEYIGGSMNYDIALLKITGSDRIKNSNAKAVTFADSNKVAMGDTVYAVGNGGGDGIAMTKGIINYTSETLSIKGADDVTDVSFRVLRYDAAVNPGNSGGALFNGEGHLVGVVNAKLIDQKVDNVGYAIPSNVAKNVVENILYYYERTGITPVEVKKLVFGISYTNSETYADFDERTGKISFRDNLHVESVKTDSLVAGQIIAEDIITKVKVERGGVETEYDLVRAYILADLALTIRAGDRITLTYERKTGNGTVIGEATFEVTDEDLVVSE